MGNEPARVGGYRIVTFTRCRRSACDERAGTTASFAPLMKLWYFHSKLLRRKMEKVKMSLSFNGKGN
jgi:hypothetical protein